MCDVLPPIGNFLNTKFRVQKRKHTDDNEELLKEPIMASKNHKIQTKGEFFLGQNKL